MTRILVTGGTGTLGSAVVARLAAGPAHTVRIMSRHARPAGLAPGVEWAQADLASGAGIDAAVLGVDTVIHAASNARQNTQQVDVEGTNRLVEAARAAGVAHLVYISIVGIDHMLAYPYYRAKLAAETMITGGAVPWTILRATQFHDLLDRILTGLARLPLLPIPAATPFQPVDHGEVADALVRAALAGPSGRLPDMGGPEVLSMTDIARQWLRARRLRGLVIPIWMPGAAARSFRAGYRTCPRNRQGRITWAEWLASKYGSSAASIPRGGPDAE